MSVTNNRNTAAPRKHIFISYRVKDTAAATGRLADALKQHLEEDQIFMDIDKLEPGVDFTEVISRSLDACDVLLAVIGPDWTGYDPDTRRSRIQDPNDWVRLELVTALKRNIRVVPVLVDDAVLPQTEELPEDLHPLLRRQTYEISNKRWKYDTDQLIAFLEKTCGISSKQQRPEPLLQQRAPEMTARPAAKGNPVIKIVVGILAFVGVLGVIGLCLPQEDTNADLPVKPHQEPHAVYNNGPAPDGSNSNNPVEPAQQQQAAAHIGGRWQDPVNSGIFVFGQNGNDLQLATYSGTGEQTGSGTGYINGRQIHMDVNLLNVAQVAIEATLSADGREITGQYKIQQNGAAYTEQMRLIR